MHGIKQWVLVIFRTYLSTFFIILLVGAAMFRIFRKMLASLLVVTILTISNLSFSSRIHAATHKQYVDIQSPLVELLQNIVHGFQDLDYHTSKEMVFKIPAVDQEIYFDLETNGSGDLFEPLPAIRGQLRTTNLQSGNALDKDATTTDKFAELGKTVFKNELLKRSKDTEFVKWMLENSELSPLKLFVIKEVLLLVDSIKKQDLDQLKIETVCLLFRLSLTKDFGIINKDKPLTEQFPQEVREALGAKFCAYIDDTWATIVRGMSNETIKEILDTQKKNAGLTVQSFVCKDQALAHDVFNHVKKYSGTEFQKHVSQFVKDKDIEIVSNRDFSPDDNSDQDDDFSTKLATFRTIGGISNQDAVNDLPQEVREKMSKTSLFPVTINAQTAQGQYWVCYVTDRLGLIDSGKLGLAALVKALRQYAGKRQEYVKAHGDEIKKQRKAREGDVVRIQKVNSFLQTDAGRESAQRIAQALDQLAVVDQAPVLDVQELQKNLEKAQYDLNALNVSVFEKKQELETIKKRADLEINTQRSNQLQLVIDTMQVRLQNLDAKIIDKTAEIAQLNTQLLRVEKVVRTQTTKIAELKKDLKDLQMIEHDQKRNNGKVSQDVTNEIASLKQEILALGVQESPVDTLEDRIKLRAKQAVVYEQEAVFMGAELDSKKHAIEAIKDLNKRRRELCKFTHMKNFYNLYIEDLNNKAVTIQQDNDLMLELKTWREELRGTKMADIAKDDLERISLLEQRVGYLVDNKKYEGFLFKFITHRPELRDFFADSMNNKNAYHQELVDVLSVVAKKSGHIQDNILVYRDIVRVFMPAFLIIFDEATGFLGTTYGQK